LGGGISAYRDRVDDAAEAYDDEGGEIDLALLVGDIGAGRAFLHGSLARR
jgi:hypothetical protein